MATIYYEKDADRSALEGVKERESVHTSSS